MFKVKSKYGNDVYNVYAVNERLFLIYDGYGFVWVDMNYYEPYEE